MLRRKGHTTQIDCQVPHNAHVCYLTSIIH